MKIDVKAGRLASNMATYFIILTTGSVLYAQGIKIQTIEEAAKAQYRRMVNKSVRRLNQAL